MDAVHSNLAPGTLSDVGAGHVRADESGIPKSVDTVASVLGDDHLALG
jgi:hypothetical protein